MKKIVDTLEFLIALSVFLPVTFEAIFQKSELLVGDITLTWGIVVGLLILCYLVLCLDYFYIRNKYQEILTKTILYLCIFSFVPFLFIAGLDKDGIVYFPWTFVMVGSLFILLFGPLILLIELLLCPIFFDVYCGHKEKVKIGTYRRMIDNLLRKS